MGSLVAIVAVAWLQSSLALAIKPVSMLNQGSVGAEQATTDPAKTSNPPDALKTVITEPIAQAIVARLSKQPVDPETLCAVRDGIWEAIRRGNPLTLDQVYGILAEHGYEPAILHAPPDR